MASIDRILEAFADRLDAQRVLCLLAEHPEDPPWESMAGGPGDGTLVTVEREVLRGLPSVKRHWQRRPANGTYGALLREVRAHRAVAMVTSSMPDGILRTLYQAQGVRMSYVCTLGHDDMHVHRYIAVHWTSSIPLAMQRYTAAIGKSHRSALKNK